MSSPLAALGNRTPEQLRVPELREELRKRGIQFKGLKKDLVDRLEEVLRQEEAEQIALAKKNEAAGDDASAPSEAAADGPNDPVTPTADKGTDDDERDSDAGPKENVAPEPENVIVAEDVSKGASEGAEDLPAQGHAEEVVIADIPSTAANVESEAEVTNLNIEVATTVTVVEETMIAAPVAVVDHSEAPLEDKVSVQAAPIVEEEPETEVSTIVEEQSVSESVVVVSSTVDNEDTIKPAVPEEGLGDLNVVQEEVVQEETTVAEVVAAVVGGGEVDGPAVPMNVEEQTVTTIMEEKTVTTTVVMEQIVTTTMDEQTVTTNVAEQYVRNISEEEHTTMSVDDKEPVKEIEDKIDDVMEEAAQEDDHTVVDGTQEADGEAKTEADKPMEIDANSHKDSKRKDTADGDTRAQEPTKRRRWNTGVGEIDAKAPARIAITEAVTEVPPSDLKEEPSSNPPVSATPTSTTPKVAPAPEKVAITRAIPSRTEGVVNGEVQKARVVPPSAKPATTSLKIDRFLRPFTFKAVKVLLAQTGTVEDVWMDQIKTHCFVTYSSVEEATATRNALYNVQWPPQGGRLLTAEFVEPSEVKSRCDAEKAAAAAATPATVPTTNAITPRGVVPAKTKTPTDSGAGVTGPSSSDSAVPASATLPPPPPLPFPPRERPKQELEKTPTLDDLFKKTRAKPQIYYLPLTSQQVAERLANRNQASLTKPGVKA